MRDFVRRHPVRSSFWGEVEDLTLLSAALLTLGIEPTALGAELDATGELVGLDELPENFESRIEVLCSAVRAGGLKPLALILDKHAHIDENKTRVKTDDFVAWCVSKRLPHNIPNRVAPQPTTKWPWGNYETKLLRELAAAAERFWTHYDPSDPSTAPTSKQVEKWLVDRAVALRTAQVMATILRADGLRSGPRK